MLNNKGQPQATNVQVVGDGVQGLAEEAPQDQFADFNAAAVGQVAFDQQAAPGGFENPDAAEPAAKRAKM